MRGLCATEKNQGPILHPVPRPPLRSTLHLVCDPTLHMAHDPALRAH
jgi:hypothetical protein